MKTEEEIKEEIIELHGDYKAFNNAMEHIDKLHEAQCNRYDKAIAAIKEAKLKEKNT